MPRIFDFNLEVHDRFVTLASIAASKESEKKLVEVTADSAEDARAAEAAGIEMAVTMPSNLADVRAGSQRLFVTAAIDFVPEPPLAVDELLRTSVTCLEQGADAVHTCRNADSIAKLVAEGVRRSQCAVRENCRAARQIGRTPRPVLGAATRV